MCVISVEKIYFGLAAFSQVMDMWDFFLMDAGCISRHMTSIWNLSRIVKPRDQR